MIKALTTLILCAVVAVSSASIACSGARAQGASPVITGNENTAVLHGNYIWKSSGFSVSGHAPFVEAGQMYFDGAGKHWGSSTINQEGISKYNVCPTFCGGTYNVNDRFEGTFLAPTYGDSCNLEVNVDGSTAYCVSTDANSTWIMEFSRRGD